MSFSSSYLGLSLADISAAEFAEKIIHSNIPDCVHVFVRSDANSSLRTQSAAAALNALVSVGGPEFDQHYRTQVMNRCKKQKHLLINITPPCSTLTPISWETDIKHKVVVFDGGIGITPPPDVSLFYCLCLFNVAIIVHFVIVLV
jgi:hypothetical protein